MFDALDATAAIAEAATNEEAASGVNANGFESEVCNPSYPSVAEAEYAMQLPQEHCDRCNRDVAYSMMAMVGLCDVCANELDADYREFEQDRASTLLNLIY